MKSPKEGVENLTAGVTVLFQRADSSLKKRYRRVMQEDDVIDFLAIARDRKDKKQAVFQETESRAERIKLSSREIRNIESLLDDLYQRHPYRVGRIRGDLKWLKKEAAKRRSST